MVVFELSFIGWVRFLLKERREKDKYLGKLVGYGRVFYLENNFLGRCVWVEWGYFGGKWEDVIFEIGLNYESFEC